MSQGHGHMTTQLTTTRGGRLSRFSDPLAAPRMASVLVTDWDRAPVRLSSRDASRVFGLSVGQR